MGIKYKLIIPAVMLCWVPPAVELYKCTIDYHGGYTLCLCLKKSFYDEINISIDLQPKKELLSSEYSLFTLIPLFLAGNK